MFDAKKYYGHKHVSNDIHFDLKQKIKGSASFYCFNHYAGNHDNHNLFLPIVMATETIELILSSLIIIATFTAKK